MRNGWRIPICLYVVSMFAISSRVSGAGGSANVKVTAESTRTGIWYTVLVTNTGDSVLTDVVVGASPDLVRGHLPGPPLEIPYEVEGTWRHRTIQEKTSGRLRGRTPGWQIWFTTNPCLFMTAEERAVWREGCDGSESSILPGAKKAFRMRFVKRVPSLDAKAPEIVVFSHSTVVYPVK